MERKERSEATIRGYSDHVERVMKDWLDLPLKTLGETSRPCCIFDDFLADQAVEDALIEQTAFEQTAIWRALFDFQRDGLRAVLSKIEKHGDCILADSVGLGKPKTR